MLKSEHDACFSVDLGHYTLSEMSNTPKPPPFNVLDYLANAQVSTLQELVDKRQKELNLSDNQLYEVLGIERMTLKRMLGGDTQKVDLFSILKLDQFLQIGAEEILEVYMSSLRPEFAGQLEKVRNATYISRFFDLPGLKKVGFIDSITDFEHIERRITRFFELDSIVEYDREVGSALFSRTNSHSDDKMRDFWVRSAIHQFKRYNNPNDYDRDALLALIPKIRPYTRYEEKGLFTVMKALYNVGVTVIVQSYLAKTQVRGGTFAVDGKPCIVVTDFNLSYATLWFALLHEIFHVCYDFEDLKRGLVYHLTDSALDLHLMREDDADYFAREMLFRQEKLDYIRHAINSPAIVAAYAEKHQVHPAIIYAFYCYHEEKQDRPDAYAQYRKYFGKPDKALQIVRSNPWDKETIWQEIETFKKRFETA